MGSGDRPASSSWSEKGAFAFDAGGRFSDGMDAAIGRELENVFGLVSSSWMMNPAERLAIIGLLEVLRPRRALEVGFGYGGFTRVLSRYAAEVHTVDTEERVLAISRELPQVTAWHATSDEVLPRFAAEGARFDFCLLDGDHSRAAARRDLDAAIGIADVIVMHDAGNPECRAGYAEALAAHDVYANLDWVDGRIQVDGPWGGFGVVLTGYPRGQPYRITPVRVPNFELVAAAWAARSAAG